MTCMWLKLTAHAANEMSQESVSKQAFKVIEETSQQAVNEMRALIWQLKPVGLERSNPTGFNCQINARISLTAC